LKKHKEHKSVSNETQVHHKHKPKINWVMIGIIVLIVLIIGAIIATVVLTKDKTKPTKDTNNTIISPDNNLNLTIDEFKTRYMQLMLTNQELMTKVQPEVFTELEKANQSVFDGITTKLSLDKSKIDNCIAINNSQSTTFDVNKAKILAKIIQDTQFGQAVGINGTPSIIVNGNPIGGYVPYTDLKKAIDDALDGNKTVDELYNPEDTYFGNKDAKVVVYVYSDYYCSYCKKLAEESIVLLKTEYINTNKIKYVPKDYIRIEPSAAIYARCAQEQNKYLDAELELFNNYSTLSGNIQTSQSKVTEKYSEEIKAFEDELAILKKWAEEHPEEFKQFQEEMSAQAQ